ncbi:amino acid ABC transporter membrane protein, PAAT family [Desulfocicer vacuolatum DSM 3385]|uniref:Glutamate/aspartate import permease protein GltK n=1 Tax=Desulfocicer vacuolatum DSM 3385 TaxID=1121400 RepID=A0A1W2DK49_9BACT|nr:amino acid ABC transporter permease [Desulfocicer vacuolatum]SMC97835.1 amino acid ABC transporter membrane protein, PAAT family [Desulfocicer vacuolatum DSM 3385]
MSETQETGGCTIPPEAHAVLEEIENRQKRFKRNTTIALLSLTAFIFFLFYVIKLDFMFMGKWVGFILTGMGFTLLVSFLAISLACILSILGALGRLSKNPIANSIATAYVSLIRGTPLLVQVYMWYLALPQLGKALEDIGIPGIQNALTLPAIPAGILALGVCYGAYMTETVRAGIQSITIGQREAAKALGMTESQAMRRIIFPQALRIIIPPISNEFIAMIKDSSLVSLMGVWELSYRAIKIGRRYFQSLEMLIMVAFIYWLMCVVLQYVQEKIEAHMARGDRRVH